MHKHQYTDTAVAGHPLLAGLTAFLKSHRVAEDSVKFLKGRVRFLYPKTVWISLAAEDVTDVGRRSDSDPSKMGELLNRWFIKKGEFHAIVCDLSAVTIFSEKWINEFIACLIPNFKAYFLTASSELQKLIQHSQRINSEAFFSTNFALIAKLRTDASLNRIQVQMPKALDMPSFDAVLSKSANRTALKACDIVNFDFEKLSTTTFEAISMIPAVLHSMAHKHGVLFDSQQPSHRVQRLNKKYDVLRILDSYLIERHVFPADDIRSPSELGLRMTAFTQNELFDLKDLSATRFRSMAQLHSDWFFQVAGLTSRSRPATIDTRGDFIRIFREMINELLDNVAIHADGLGYLMFDLVPNEGLYFYIGDTGIGLARSLNRGYRKMHFDDAEAVSHALRLIHLKENRRSRIGFGTTGGRGLERVRVILEELGGTISIRSGRAQAVFAPGKNRDPQELRQRLYNVQGTHIHILIPTNITKSP